MVSEPTPSADTGNGPSSEALIFVSDASAEAERITSGLRVRGYLTVDVPLGLLVGRVAVQPPALILCDVDAPQALETIERMRALPSTSNIDVLFIGEAGRTLDEQAERVGVQGSGIFVRPVDVGALTRRIETLLGPPKTTGARLSSPPQASRVPVLVAATRKPYRYDARGKASRPSFESIPPPPLPSDPPQSNSQWPSSPTASGETRPGLSARTSLDPYAGFDTRGGGEGRTGHDLLENADPYAISPDLAQLLGRAERRVLESKHFAAHGERLSPEAELEAILPEDLLSALDEPLDELDGDDDDPGTPGTHGESSFGARSRSSHDSQGGGTSPGGAAPAPAARESTTSGGDRVDEIAQEKPAPALEPVRDMAPATPQASRHQRTSPPSLTHTGVDTGFGSIPPAPALPSEALPGNAAAPPSSERDSSPAQRHRRSTRPPRPRPPRELGEDSSAELEPGPPPRPAITGPHAQGSTYGTGPASSSRNGSRAERTAPPHDRNERGPSAPERADRVEIEIPNTLRAGDALRVLARAVRARYSGAIAFEDNAGIRRVVLRDGDFVIAAAGIETESLLNFLVQRGDLSAEVAQRLGRKLPQFGRHAGAALIAQGHMRQEDLWPVLRAHAEWLLTRVCSLGNGVASLERVVPPRLSAEPSVFGGATGAEVLIEVVRRAITPQQALAWLGGPELHLGPGEAETLLTECALSDTELEWVRSAAGTSIQELLERSGSLEFSNVLLTLVELGILRTHTSAVGRPRKPQRRVEPDRIDEEAVRARIRARRALVEEGDYFALLGVSRTATSYDIRRAYTSLRQEFDPVRILTPQITDLTEDLELILDVLDEAYEILGDPARRERYRRALED